MSTALPTDFELRQRIQSNLDSFSFHTSKVSSLRRAAVALVITSMSPDDHRSCLLLTRRPARLNQHSGQYALPGGKLDQGETVYDAAQRELGEELGLELPSDAILGRLDDYATRSGFCIAPIVFWAGPDATLDPSPDEVAAVFKIPFEELDSSALPVLEQGVDPHRPVLCSEFPTLGHRMYAPTAAVMYQFREVALRGESTRVDHFDQPEFAWR